MSIFDSIAVRSLPESVFDLSHEVKLSGNMGDLIPILLQEVIPGDTFQVKSQILMRLAPMLAPIMHRVNVFVHYFYVPNRLVWEDWHDHITGGEDGNANPAFPKIGINQAKGEAYFSKGSLADYYGCPVFEPGTTVAQNTFVSALPFRGNALIYNEFYRDQDLETKIDVKKSSGNLSDEEVAAICQIRQRAWQKDYFTSARPNAQKGAQVIFPEAEIVYKNSGIIQGSGGVSGNLSEGNNGDLQNDVAGQVNIENIESIGTTTVEDQRRANRLQEWMELAQRGGSRINEVIKNFFGVTPDDLRLQRPQYLGGGVQPITMSEVLNTAGSQGGVGDPALQPLGEYGGHGISVGQSNQFTKRFKEHGYVHGIMSVLPKTAYQQGLERHWLKFDKYERYWPQFANIGEQEILRSEIYHDYQVGITDDENNPTANEQTFGYAPRYSEYKYACDRVAGEFRKTPTSDNLSYWHMGRYFETPPTLNDTFVKSDPTHRIFAVQDDTVDKLYVQVYHKFKAKRKMPYHNMPSNMPV